MHDMPIFTLVSIYKNHTVIYADFVIVIQVIAYHSAGCISEIKALRDEVNRKRIKIHFSEAFMSKFAAKLK